MCMQIAYKKFVFVGVLKKNYSIESGNLEIEWLVILFSEKYELFGKKVYSFFSRLFSIRWAN